MTIKFPPISADASIDEQAVLHDRWFRAKVEASLADSRPSIAHDDVMAQMDELIDAAEKRRRDGDSR